jgi:hypothetical protein
MSFFSHYDYWVMLFLAMAGLFIVIARGNLIKKLVGLAILQTSVYLLYLAPGKIVGGTAPIVDAAFTRLLEPAAAGADPDGDRRRRRHAGSGPGAGGAHPRGVRHHRRRRDPAPRCDTAPTKKQRPA